MSEGIPLHGDRAAYRAKDYQSEHADDIDDAAGIHHTLGTGAAQAAAGNHDHDADYAAIDHNHDLDYSAIGHTHVEADITDLDHNALKIQSVPVTAPVSGDDGKALIFDDATGEFIYGEAGGTVASLDDVGDVNAPAPSDGDVLTWDDTAGEWTAAAPTGGTITDHDHSGDAGDGGTFDAANLTSGAATDGYVLTADGSGGAAWESPPAGGVVDADDVTYTPTTATDWDGDADPGDVEQALDQLAERVDDLEAGGGTTDADAIHDNVSGEIAALTEKTTPADNDVFIIEDSEASNAKKKITWASIVAAAGVTGAFLVASTFPTGFMELVITLTESAIEA